MANGSVMLEVILQAVDRLTGPLRQSGSEFDKLAKRAEAAGARARKTGQDMANVGRGMMVAGAAVGAGLGKAVSDFAEFQAGQAEAINAFSTKDGLSGSFAKITEQAIEMGNLYPATTGQMFELATAMKMAGANAENMANGGFKATGALQVLLKLNPREAGQYFQEMSNAMGVAGEDAEKFADMIQRVKNVSGLKFEGMHEAFKYLGAPLKKLGIQGGRDMPLIMAAMGALKQGGLDDSQVGTSMGQFFDRMAVAQARIKGGDTRGAAMKYAFEGLDKAGVDLQFFDEKGNFNGAANAFAQIEQLKKASLQVQSLAGKALFGTEGQRIITSASMEQINAMLKAMGNEESLAKRVDRILKTLSNRWTALTGTTTNAMVGIGKSMEPVLNPLLERLNEIVTYTQGWIDRNPKLTATITTAAAAFSVFMLGGGGALWATGKMISLVGTLASTWGQVGAKIMVAAPWMVVAALAGAAIAANWDDVEPAMKRAERSFDSAGRGLARLFGKDENTGAQWMRDLDAGAIAATAYALAVEHIGYALSSLVATAELAGASIDYLKETLLKNPLSTMAAAKNGWDKGGVKGAFDAGNAQADRLGYFTGNKLGNQMVAYGATLRETPWMQRSDDNEGVSFLAEMKKITGGSLVGRTKAQREFMRREDANYKGGDTNYNITINAAPGDDAEKMADKFRAAIKRKDASESRKAYSY
jgi:TP901 family phage tail tape measure protein